MYPQSIMCAPNLSQSPSEHIEPIPSIYPVPSRTDHIPSIYLGARQDMSYTPISAIMVATSAEYSVTPESGVVLWPRLVYDVCSVALSRTAAI